MKSYSRDDEKPQESLPLGKVNRRESQDHGDTLIFKDGFVEVLMPEERFLMKSDDSSSA
jgi:hypothetical protein